LSFPRKWEAILEEVPDKGMILMLIMMAPKGVYCDDRSDPYGDGRLDIYGDDEDW
jgi:hypothetical protein